MIRLALALLLAFGSLSQARAEPRELVIGVEELDYYPAYAFIDQEYIGAARDILDAFAQDRDYRVVYRPFPIKRLYQELAGGGIDAKFPDSPAWGAEAKRDVALHYSQPVIAYLDGVMVPPGALGHGIDSVRVLGTVSGFTPSAAWVDRLQAGGVVVKENPKLDLLLRQAVLRRLDGAYVNVAVAQHMLDRVLAMPGALAFDPGLPHIRDSYRLSSRRPELTAEFDAWLKANAARVAEIKRRFNAEKGVD